MHKDLNPTVSITLNTICSPLLFWQLVDKQTLPFITDSDREHISIYKISLYAILSNCSLQYGFPLYTKCQILSQGCPSCDFIPTFDSMIRYNLAFLYFWSAWSINQSQHNFQLQFWLLAKKYKNFCPFLLLQTFLNTILPFDIVSNVSISQLLPHFFKFNETLKISFFLQKN